MKTTAFRLPPGSDLREALLERAGTEHMGAAFVLSAVGSLTRACIRYADAPAGTSLDGPLEILTLSGTLSDGGCHFHISVSDRNGQVIGGHLLSGSIVHTTAEIVLGLTDEYRFDREPDEATGYRELVVSQRR